MKLFNQILIASILTVGLLSTAQAADIKIGFVNVARILEKAPQAEKAKVALEKEFSPRNKRLLASQKEIKKLDEKLARDAKLTSESETRRLQRDVLEKKRALNRDQEEFREDFNLRRNEELAKLQKLVFEAIKGLSEAEKYDLVLHDGVVFASGAVDITNKVQNRLSTGK
ncbi:MAG: OmpH family outer membrane protein [Cycloclasticus sp.]|uniref:OmpH family outer membrane protein n=1 Tax=Cycloclasticus sp. TaxID=2024830 RepID=UPI0025805D72|nr:OmpH family outer membrane protein [Cycloclasticus sp.]MBV1899012.1 OmpH family outer membrane protein [Cycloclasticus sp.]